MEKMTDIDKAILEFAGWEWETDYLVCKCICGQKQSHWHNSNGVYEKPTIDLNFLIRECVPKLFEHDMSITININRDLTEILIKKDLIGIVVEMYHQDPTEALKQAIIQAIRRNDAE